MQSYPKLVAPMISYLDQRRCSCLSAQNTKPGTAVISNMRRALRRFYHDTGLSFCGGRIQDYLKPPIRAIRQHLRNVLDSRPACVYGVKTLQRMPPTRTFFAIWKKSIFVGVCVKRPAGLPASECDLSPGWSTG